MPQIKHWNNIENAILNSSNNSDNGINNITSNDDSGGINSNITIIIKEQHTKPKGTSNRY